ncbi:unnamed protein product [Plutella xylostella]|uniref:(diamondback moth) hypothetical protein n=1 Tax=Plutella xylostella TaxID=51655 RepID=A0A8S4FUB0_PLUXY|nr:unnamed protein product [Plutella xylostella]
MDRISSLVSSRGEGASGAAVQRVGAAVCCAVERFVAVGENIADDNPDVRHSMVLACKEARAAGEWSKEYQCNTSATNAAKNYVLLLASTAVNEGAAVRNS